MRLISLVKQRSDISLAKEQKRYTLYASFFKQRSDTTHAKEQAHYTLCMPRSLSENPI